MWKPNRNDSLIARSIAPRSLQVLTLAALAVLAPVVASSAAASDAPTSVRLEASAAGAIIELVPVQPTTDVSAVTSSRIEAAASALQETVVGRGSASYYASKFNGRRTASGERFDSTSLTAAHRTLPFGSLVRVTNVASGKSVVVRINDRGPFSHGRMIDVSRAAAEEIGLVSRGHGTVELALIED
jgi:rare lipoprotein A